MESSDDEEILREIVQKKRYLVDDFIQVATSTRHYQASKRLRIEQASSSEEVHPIDNVEDSSGELPGYIHSPGSLSPHCHFIEDLLIDDQQLVTLLQDAHQNFNDVEEVPPASELVCGENVVPDLDFPDSPPIHETDSDADETDVAVGLEDILSSNALRKLLHEKSSFTVDEAVLMVMDLYVNNRNVSKKLLGDIASIIHNLLPQPNDFPSSKYVLFNYLKNNAPTYKAIIHYICKECEYYMGLQSIFAGQLTICKACGSETVNRLYEFPLKEVVKHLFEVRKLQKVLFKPEQRSYLGDITDGNIYKSFAEKMGPYDITAIWNCDGVSVSKSSNAQLWPIQFTICEVPPFLRRRFLVVCGFFFGSSKPNLNSFLRPFVMSLREICVEGGVKWTDINTNEERSSIVRAPFCSLDAPARAQALNMVLHGGFFACGMCEVQGNQVFHIRGKKVVYPTGQAEEPPLRTAARMRQQALRATRANPIYGLYGPNIVSYIPRFDPARAVVNEYMHNTLLGVTRTFTAVWVADTRGEWHLTKTQRSRITEFLKCIFPPDVITRTPRSLDCWAQWKANEWRLWLLFYSTISLLEIRPIENKFLQHWILLVKAIYICLGEKITKQDLEQAKDLLKLFLKEIRHLYSYPDPAQSTHLLNGDWLYTFNVHQLIHTPTVVEDTGPLWSIAAFDHEDNNGNLKNLIHGTNVLDKELVNSLLLLESIRVLRCKVGENKSPEDILGERRAENSELQEFKDPILDEINTDELEKLRACVQNICLCVEDCSLFARVFSHGKKHVSRSWDRPQKRNSYSVRCDVPPKGVFYGEILYFVKVRDCDKIFFVLEVLEINHRKMIVHKDTRAILKHILPIKNNVSNEKLILSIESITCTCIKVGNYLCIPPNKVEINL